MKVFVIGLNRTKSFIKVTIQLFMLKFGAQYKANQAI
jgi:hypothetical protein